ncbi:hypothetical protein BDW16_3527 [Sphingomonas koreensis]|nr:hypothetical protein BDW16_3527 [Sphingomonas koreensis]
MPVRPVERAPLDQRIEPHKRPSCTSCAARKPH